MLPDFKQKVTHLIKAYTPLVYVDSRDSVIPFFILRDVCKSLGIDLYVWKATEGLALHPHKLRRVGRDVPKNDIVPDTQDPLGALRRICQQAQERSVSLFFNLHLFWSDPVILQSLIDFTEVNLRKASAFVCSSRPPSAIPAELKDLFMTISLPLPTVQEIREILSLGVGRAAPPIHAADEKDQRALAESSDADHALISSAQGLTTVQIVNIIAEAIAAKGCVSAENFHSAKEALFCYTNGALTIRRDYAGYDEIAGLDRLKEWFQKRKDAFTAKAREFGLIPPKGVLLIGIPGTGKTLVTRAIADLYNLPLATLDFSRIYGGIVGASEDNLRTAIQTLETIAPCICAVDEIEKGLAGVASSNLSDGGTTARVVGTFLSWLQDRRSDVLVMASANNIRQLPPELLRKGRFDEIFFLDLPNADERKELFKIHLAKVDRLPEDFNLDRLAQASEGFTGAEIETIIRDALYNAFSAHTELSDFGVIKSLKDTKPLSITMREDIEYLRHWAEGRARFASSQSQNEGAAVKGKQPRIHRIG